MRRVGCLKAVFMDMEECIAAKANAKMVCGTMAAHSNTKVKIQKKT